MVIVLKKDISDIYKSELRNFLKNNNFIVNEIVGEESTVFAAVGKLTIDYREVEILPGVDRVIPISKPYKLASREFKKENTIIEIPNNRGQIIRVGGSRLVSIAGPCAVESLDQMMSIAKRVVESGAVMLRGGAYKPRTSPYAFQGMGVEGLKILKEAGNAYGLPIVTECVATEHIEGMEKCGVDVYQIGARNMQNFELLKRVGALNKPVILKRGISATIEEWLMAAEYLLSSGTESVILCERGIRTYEKATRNTLDLSAIPVLRSLTHLPIIVDPSHAVGIRDKVAPMALAGIAAGSDGIIVEVHCNPDKAMSDGAQSLYPEQFEKLMRDIDVLAPVVDREVSRIRIYNDGAKKESKIDKFSSDKVICAYSGTRGAFAEQAINHYFENKVQSLSLSSFRDVFMAVHSGKADYGMIPIENSLAGSVYENYDNLLRFDDISIVGSIKLRIEHTLLAKDGTTVDSIKTVFSHPQGFAQCSEFLSQHPQWNLVECISTANAASDVAKKDSTTHAAIASSKAAAPNNLCVIKTGIEDNPRNYTRFILISHKDFAKQIEFDKEDLICTIAFSTKNEPGSLYKCLHILQSAELNMSRLESRPIAGQPWHYMFYVDVNISKTKKEQGVLDLAIENLSKQSEKLRVLGIFEELN
ncbi:MAG: 3-deoxy-7-phosphoheptulonate synthase [Treponema sp.]|nr:3-deoxy-7-phosphoheptulonate synthase [Treponema sp.]